MGGREPVVPDEDILRVLASTDDPALSSSEVASGLPIGQKGAYRRLKELREMGYVDSKKFGKTLAWWITNEGIENLRD